jgi:hypothetical protein
MATSTSPEDNKLDLRSKAGARDIERRLDEAIEDSFPASDPVALAMPRNRIEPRLPRIEDIPMSAWFLVGGGLLAVIALIALRR